MLRGLGRVVLTGVVLILLALAVFVAYELLDSMGIFDPDPPTCESADPYCDSPPERDPNAGLP